jgi:hypothetical protein
MSDWERRQRVHDYRALRMMMGYPGRLSEAASCAGCLLKLILLRPMNGVRRPGGQKMRLRRHLEEWSFTSSGHTGQSGEAERT